MTLAADIDLNQHQHIVLDHMSWDFYEHLLDEIGNRHIRVTYHNGRIEIMSPLPKHERWGARIALLVETMCVEKNIPMVPGGSTTFRDKAQQIGLEPDECYYLKNCEIFRQIEGSFDPTIHPPPDLAIEV